MYEARENRVRRGFGRTKRTPIIASERMTNDPSDTIREADIRATRTAARWEPN